MENGETILETAKRELKEETGAVDFDIKPICVYSVKGKTRVNESSDVETFGGKTLEKSTIEEVIISLMQTCGLGNVISPIKPVSGGFLHRMYKVTTECGTYAVKCLNPEIMGREGVLDNYERAERLECILEKADIPIVPAITFNGKKMQEIDGQYFYIFHWQEGQITDWNNISVKQCNIAGNILGKIHAIDPQKDVHKEPEISTIDWHEYLCKANEQNSEIATILADNVQLLIDVEKITTFFNGYLNAYDNGFRAYGDVFGLAYTWVDWLEYNIQRALGACVDEEERIMGISEVKNTIDRINYIRGMEEEIKEVFDKL